MAQTATASWRDGRSRPAWWVRAAPRIGVSRCLLGDPVRFNAGHKEERFLTELLNQHVEWVSVCPEIEVGMGTPRETLRLVEADGGPKMVAPGSGRDHTRDMTAFSHTRIAELQELDLAGYVLKSKSPSCGLLRLPVYAGEEVAHREGQGLFAAALVAAHPQLAMEEETRLRDPHLREHFLERIFAHARLQELLAGEWQVQDLAAFHTRHTLQLMAHDPALAEQARQLAGTARRRPADETRRAYSTTFLAAMATPPSRGGHILALQQAVGHVRDRVDHACRRDLLAVVSAYREGHVPLHAAITALRELAEGEGAGSIRTQTYFDPFPAELQV